MIRNAQQLADVSLSGEEMEEEADYVNAAVNSVKKKKIIPDQKCSNFTRSFTSLAVGWLILLVIMGLRIYFSTLNNVSDVSQLNQLKDNQTDLMAVNRNLTEINNKLSSDYENLRRNRDNLTQAYAVLESNITNLTAANRNLTKKIEELNAQNQELETNKNNLTEQIENWNKFNTSRAQWSIDQYCPITDGERQCKSCQTGWLKFEPNCYGINNPKPPGLKTWEEAQENCFGKNSDLAVVATEPEKDFVNAKSWYDQKYPQYWIGLRAVDGMWKWVDGSNLTDNSWMPQSAVDGFCAVSIQNEGWKSVNCTEKNCWICQKKALSV